jgi:hypothetical protein
MDAKELRIDNYVLHSKSGVELKLHIGLIECEYRGDYYDPIPLTKDWLLKFGLEYDKNEGHIFLQKYIFYIRDDHEEDGWDIYENVNDSFITTVEYVHQLQNLYFALTGAEIEVL